MKASISFTKSPFHSRIKHILLYILIILDVVLMKNKPKCSLNSVPNQPRLLTAKEPGYYWLLVTIQLLIIRERWILIMKMIDVVLSSLCPDLNFYVICVIMARYAHLYFRYFRHRFNRYSYSHAVSSVGYLLSAV